VLSFHFTVTPAHPVVGDPVTVSVEVSGRGGLPHYTLSGAAPVLSGDTNASTGSMLGTVTYMLTAAQAGQAHLVLSVNYETSIGCVEQPIYHFVTDSSEPYVVEVAPEATTPCYGDCDHDGMVTVDEILQGVNVVFGLIPFSCAALDANRNGAVEIDDLIKAVIAALDGCSGGFCGNGFVDSGEVCEQGSFCRGGCTGDPPLCVDIGCTLDCTCPAE
jgi:hypothetical protein